jgi:S1-C subfamily serine protease
VPRLIRDGRFVRPALGVTAGAPELARALKLPKGVPLVQLLPNGPAAKAGLQVFRRDRGCDIVQGDVITAINDEAVSDLDDMLSQLERRAPGDSVMLTLWRAGQTRKVAVALAAGE